MTVSYSGFRAIVRDYIEFNWSRDHTAAGLCQSQSDVSSLYGLPLTYVTLCHGLHHIILINTAKLRVWVVISPVIFIIGVIVIIRTIR